MEQPRGIVARDALVRLSNLTELTEYEQGSYKGGERRFEQIVRFATVDTVKAGWLLKEEGTWSVTDAGRSAYAKFTDPGDFYREAVRLYREWKRSQSDADEDEEGLGDAGSHPGSDREVTRTFVEAERLAWEETVRFLAQVPPLEFQELVADLLRGMGYFVAWVAPAGKDGGIDVLAFGDPLGARPPRIKVQVKRLQSKVPVDGLRSFLALLGDDDVGIFVNTGGFTKDAEDESRTQEKRRLTLIDAQKFFGLWVEYYGRLTDEARRRMPIKPIHFLAPAE